MIGNLKIGDQIRQSHIRFRSNNDFEGLFNAFDQDYKSEDAIFIGYVYKLNTPQFNSVNRSQEGNDCNFNHQIFEYIGNSCYIPSINYCFIKCKNYLTNSDYKEQSLDFIRIEQKRSSITTLARIQPCLRKLGIDLGFYNGKEIWPRYITERNKALFLYKIHFFV